MASVRFLGLVVTLVAFGASFVAGNFLAKHTEHHHGLSKAIVALVSSTLNATLESVANDGGGGAACKRCPAIERSISSTFQALPKNAIGRLSPRAVRHIVHSYFVKEHGWFIQGLELDGLRKSRSEVESAGIIRAKAPAMIEGLLEDRRAGRGLTFEDIVAMVATLERLILLESLELIESAYAINDMSSSQRIDQKALHEVMLSFVLMYRQDEPGNVDDPAAHMRNKEEASKMATPLTEGGEDHLDYWTQIMDFQRSAVKGFEHAHRHQLNPFETQRFSFDAATNVAEALVHDFGKWQNEECMAMKNALMPLDPKHTGRVPLKVFWAQPETEIYSFTETQEYLREAGALDESPGQGPSVRIANYLAGPSNCIAQSEYTAICCLDECAGLTGELEGTVQGPTAEPLHLLRVVQNLSSSTVDAPRKVSDTLTDKLHRIADRNAGTVPLHGRLFAQWMHFAFPNECPFPAESPLEAISPSQFNKSSILTSMERPVFAQAIGDHGDGANYSTALIHQHWRDVEILHLHEEDTANHVRSFSWASIAWVPYATLVIVAARMAVGMWKSAMVHAQCGEFEKTMKVGTIV